MRRVSSVARLVPYRYRRGRVGSGASVAPLFDRFVCGKGALQAFVGRVELVLCMNTCTRVLE